MCQDLCTHTIKDFLVWVSEDTLVSKTARHKIMTKCKKKRRNEMKLRMETNYFGNWALEDFYFQFIQLILELEYENFYCIENIVLERKKRLHVLAENPKPRRNR